jgi:hypothetical protein
VYIFQTLRTSVDRDQDRLPGAFRPSKQYFIIRNSHVTITFLIRSNHGGQVTPPCDLAGSIHPRHEPSRHN